MLDMVLRRHHLGALGWTAHIGTTGRDLVAGFALMAVAIPEQIATARLAGAPPALGLLVFAAAALGFFLLGSNRFLSVGADSTIAPIFAAALAGLAASASPHYLALAALLAVEAGAIVALAGLLRLGWVARLLSVPVITGFLAGISVHILVSQLPALLGVAAGHGMPLEALAAILSELGQTHVWTLATGLFVLALVIVCERIDFRIPGALIAVALAGIATPLLGLPQKGVTTLGTMTPPSLWPLKLDLAPQDALSLLPIAFLVSLIVIIQTVTVCRSFRDEGDDINRDLVGVGLGNIFAGAAGGFPANASPPRTAIACEAGAASKVAGLFAALGAALFLTLGLRLLAYVPQAALAGLLLFVARRIFRFDMMKLVWSQSRAEFALLAATMAAIVLAPIQTGVAIGIGLSLLHGVWTITQTHALIFEQMPGSTVWWPRNPRAPGVSRPGLVVVGFQAPLFFLNAETFRRTITEAIQAAPQPVHCVILEASSIVEIDFSGAQVLLAMIERFNAQGVTFYIARLESVRAQQALERFGVLAKMGDQTIFHSVADAVRTITAEANPASTG